MRHVSRAWQENKKTQIARHVVQILLIWSKNCAYLSVHIRNITMILIGHANNVMSHVMNVLVPMPSPAPNATQEEKSSTEYVYFVNPIANPVFKQ